MKTSLTETMLAKVEEWKAGYANEIAANRGEGTDWNTASTRD